MGRAGFQAEKLEAYNRTSLYKLAKETEESAE